MFHRALALVSGALLCACFLTTPATAGTTAGTTATDTTPPSAPVIQWAFEQPFLELMFGYSLSTDDVTPTAQITYELYLDGEFESDIVPIIRPEFPNSSRAFAYADAPGPVTLTLLAVDAAGNRSALSNAVTITAFE